MADSMSIVTGSVSIARGVVDLINYLRSVAGANVLSAYFNWDGSRIEGSDKIAVEQHLDEDDSDSWWFSVTDLSEYVFVRFPVVESCAHELVGQVRGEKNPDARYWRWVAPVPPGAIAGGKRANLMVNFVVMGYRPKALIKHLSSTG